MTSAPDLPRLPSGFRFGASTAAYQIEGAADEDGRGPSVWDTFCARPGTIADGSSGAVACDHYHRYPEDVGLMKDLGIGGYRLSVSWSRIQPEGSGRANPAGLAFYDRLVDTLLEAGVRPMVTLFHWDLPQALEDRGGWLQRDTVERFAEYATLLGMRLGDRVEHWCPVNEPNIVTMLGHALGVHAPGKQLMFDALPVAHHLNLAHGRAAAALRATGARSVGTANNHAPVWAATDAPADVNAAALYDVLLNRIFADPMLLGRYPEGFADLMPGPVAEDLAVISAPVDFYGVNYYSPARVADPASPIPPSPGVRSENAPFKVVEVEGYPRTAFDWPVVPDGLRELLVGLKTAYGESCRRSTSPRTAVPTTTRSARTGRCTTTTGSRTSTRTCGRWRRPSTRGSTSPATTPGRCSTTSSGPRGTPSASAWCTSTTTPSSAPPRTRLPGTAT